MARAAKVSASTVSRYFNHPELLKSSTRKRIDTAVRKTGYIRNRAAQTIHGIRSGTIGVLVPTLDHAIFAEVVQAFSDEVAKQGFTILLASHGYDPQREYAILRKMLEHRVDGIVLTGLDHDEAVFQLIESQTIPSVLMWNFADTARCPCIGTDNQLAGRLIAEHVLRPWPSRYRMYVAASGRQRPSERPPHRNHENTGGGRCFSAPRMEANDRLQCRRIQARHDGAVAKQGAADSPYLRKRRSCNGRHLWRNRRWSFGPG